MDFKLHFSIPASPFVINHQSKIVLMGSCFAQNIGDKLISYKFNSLVNPLGILFNPVSIANAINFIINPGSFQSKFITERNGIFQSWMHHGKIFSNSANSLLQKIENDLHHANNSIAKADVLFITLGSANVYRHNNLHVIVANCHKHPANQFTKVLLSPQEIIHQFGSAILLLKEINPMLKIVFSVSPVKYLKDGLHQNNISKGILHYAINKLCQTHTNVFYFDAYEIVNDELRDYRFYKEDFAHPTEQAIDYVWQRFSETYFNTETLTLIKALKEINTALYHKPIIANTNEHLAFKNNMLNKVKILQQEYSFLNMQQEYNYFS